MVSRYAGILESRYSEPEPEPEPEPEYSEYPEYLEWPKNK